MTSIYDELIYVELMLSLISAVIILTALMVNKLRQEIRELKEMLQQRLPPETNAIESE